MVSPILATGILLGLMGCSTFYGEYVECPPVYAAEGAEEGYLVGSKLGQPIKVRFSGISGQCLPADGYTDMRLNLNMLFRRDMTSGSKIERVEFHVTAAIVDPDNNVVSREIITDEASFRGGIDISQPDIIERLYVPDGHRVVLAIGRAAQ